REPDPSRARERDPQRRLHDRGEPEGREPEGRHRDGRGSLEREAGRREARECRVVRHDLPEPAPDENALRALSPLAAAAARRCSQTSTKWKTWVVFLAPEEVDVTC